MLFFGSDFFIHQNPTLMSYMNGHGNSWRPDIGFGTSFFYGDPTWHSWAFFSLWDKFFASPVTAYSSVIVLINTIGAITLYFLLKKVLKDASNFVWILCPIIAFTSAQIGFQLMRLHVGIITAPLLMITCYNYFNKEKIDYKYILYFALILWVSFAFGSMLSLSSMLSCTLIFAISYHIYHHSFLKKTIVKLTLLYLIGLGALIFLAFWIFYSSLLEISIYTPYRAKESTGITWSIIPDSSRLTRYIIALFQIEWFPWDIGFPRKPIGYLVPSNNVLAIFPLVFLFFIFRKSETFWEFFFKIICSIFLIHELLLIFPLYFSVFRLIGEKSMHFISMVYYDILFTSQLGLIAIYLFGVDRDKRIIKVRQKRIIQKCFALILIIFYSTIAFFSLIGNFSPQFFPSIAESIILKYSILPNINFTIDAFALAASGIISYIQTGFSGVYIIFIILTIGLLFVLINDKWQLIIGKYPKGFSIILLINALIFTWSVYPLNKKELLWNKHLIDLPAFNSYDRFYYANDDHRDQIINKKYYESLLNKYGGNLNYLKSLDIYGYEISPWLNLHGHRSFSRTDEAEYLFNAFNYDGINRLKNIRNLEHGPLIRSNFLDMGSVVYYYTKYKLLNPPNYLELLYSSTDNTLSIYKNLNAWPYYYLADRLEVIENSDINNKINPGTAYVFSKDYYELDNLVEKGTIKMVKFFNGKMEYSFQSDKNEFLVVADIWHPFWKANINDKEIEIIKANSIFKGVKLPAGNYNFSLYFDTTPYYFGIYVSILFWLFFVILILRLIIIDRIKK